MTKKPETSTSENPIEVLLESENLPEAQTNFIKSIGNYYNSEEFVKGFLFVLSCVFSLDEQSTEAEENPIYFGAKLKHFFPHDFRLDDAKVGDLYDGKINQILEQFLFKIDSQIVFRDIEVGDVRLHILNPQNGPNFSDCPNGSRTMKQTSQLFTEFCTLLGAILNESKFNFEYCIRAGNFYINQLFTADTKATGQIRSLLRKSAPPFFLYTYTYIEGLRIQDFSQLLPTQTYLGGIILGGSENFTCTVWEFQRDIFFYNGDQIDGIEALSTVDYFEHCCATARNFINTHGSSIPPLSQTNINREQTPDWADGKISFDDVKNNIFTSWGYDIDNCESNEDYFLARAGIIFVIICGIMKSKDLVELNAQVEAQRDQILKIMELANEGDAEAQYEAARIMGSGEHGEINTEEANQWIKKSAEQGYSPAQCAMGIRYLYGDGFSTDYILASEWLKLSCEQGNPHAMFYLGQMKSQGLGMSKSPEAGFLLCQNAAKIGLPIAELELAAMFDAGHGTEVDHKKSFNWLKISANKGNHEAQFYLGLKYRDGIGTAIDFKEAAHWMKLSAEKGNVKAQTNLGELFYSGRGVNQDFSEAVYWYKQAAKSGAEIGQFNLGRMYFDGLGVSKSVEEACTWITYSALQGFPDAKLFLEETMIKKISKEKMLEIKQLCEERLIKKDEA